MNTFAKTIRVGVISLIPDWQLFCALDEQRVLFFKHLKLSELPAYDTNKQTVITCCRNGNVFSTATPFLTNTSGHGGEQFNFFGFEEILVKNHEFEIKKDILKSFWFKNGDMLEIAKYDWQKDVNPISIISSARKIGTPFRTVFKGEQEKEKEVSLLLDISSQEIQKKTVIFEDSTGSKKWNRFF